MKQLFSMSMETIFTVMNSQIINIYPASSLYHIQISESLVG